MNRVIILRYGEIYLKGKNRGMFERILLKNLKESLKNFSCEVNRISGRYIVYNYDIDGENVIIDKISKVFGFVSLSTATEIETNAKDIVSYIENMNISEKSFKVAVRRADKKFPIPSMDFAAQLGGYILKSNENIKVDIHNPEIIINIDIRENGKTYIFTNYIPCHGGIPVGSSGEGLLMLSGGIDSPVAGYMMSKRGMKLSMVHFHSFPYTSEKAKQKVIELAKILTEYNGETELFIVSFTKIQEAIHVNCKSDYMIAIMRRIMMRICEKLCIEHGFQAIITGENLAQVASQTVESLTSSERVLDIMPIFRPVIGFDKLDIINLANKINTYDTSIQPYEDCCTVFLPKNPIIKPNIQKVIQEENKINIDALIEDAITNLDKIVL